MSAPHGESPQPAYQPPDMGHHNTKFNPATTWGAAPPSETMPYIVEGTNNFNTFFNRPRGKTAAEQRKAEHQHSDDAKHAQKGGELWGKPITSLVDEASVVFRGVNRISGETEVGFFGRTEAAIRGLGKIAAGVIVANLVSQVGEHVDEYGQAIGGGLEDIGIGGKFQEFFMKAQEVDVPWYALPAALAVGGLVTLFHRYRQNKRVDGDPWYKFSMDRLRPVRLKRGQIKTGGPHNHIRNENEYEGEYADPDDEGDYGYDGDDEGGKWRKFRQAIKDEGGYKTVFGNVVSNVAGAVKDRVGRKSKGKGDYDDDTRRPDRHR